MKTILLTLAKCLAFFLGWAIAAGLCPLPSAVSPAVWRLWAEITPLLAICLFTALFWGIEKRSLRLCLFRFPGKGLLIGASAGLFWLGAPVLLLWGMGAAHFTHAGPVEALPLWWIAACLNVATQELLVRGYMYQLIKQRHNLPAAVIVTSLLFTLLHGGALEAGLVPTLNVLSMSLLMTIVLEYSGSLLAPILMHAIWNSVGALLLGGVSLADDYPHLLSMVLTGSELITGGPCKVEGSIIVLAVNLLLIGVFFILYKKQRA
ncbi:MAG: type II CAAX endopeptidase family protein [Eubacteriales bacterium]|nr:type II CAAX endopeptidase family protein [Eubacteriales bacterium]